jgi:hypothetical protein
MVLCRGFGSGERWQNAGKAYLNCVGVVYKQAKNLCWQYKIKEIVYSEQITQVWKHSILIIRVVHQILCRFHTRISMHSELNRAYE